MKSQTENNPRPLYKRRWFIVLIVIVSIIVGAYIVQELQWRGGFGVIYNESEKIEREVMLPAGGVPSGPGASRGSTPWDWWQCIDVACPRVSKSWLVPIEPGKEVDFMHEIFKREGYPIESPLSSECKKWEPNESCGTTSQKGNIEIRISMGIAPSSVEQNVSPRVWRSVGISLYPVHTAQPLP